MRETGRKRRDRVEVKHNIIDRAVSFFSPVRGARRMKSRMVMAMAEAYYGASKRRRALSEWVVPIGDADTDITEALPTLRERSRDLIRNNPLASGAVNTKVTSIVGTGLKLKSRIDRNILGLDEEAADAWESRTEAEWNLFADSTACDIEAVLNFAEIQELSFRSTLENGDIFILTPAKPDKTRPYSLQLQTIEADRVCNANNASNSQVLSGGILRKEYGGAPVEYHILEGHPGNIWSKKNTWKKIKAFGPKTGRKNVIHLFHKKRVGQTRGVPDLAPVIESLKQLGRYGEAELNAAVISSFFTVFVKTESQGMGLMQPSADIGGKTSDKDFKMGSGAILDLNPDESVDFANPQRPNQSFDQFVLSISRQIGVALELPFEILVKHFTASYSAARAALLEAWRFYMGRRKWLADTLCRPVYELWLTEAVALGRIVAPGFLSGDPLIRAAYLGSEWTGPSKGQIDEKKEIEAAEKRVEMTISTLAEETAALTGGDWEQKFPQRAKEAAMIREAGLEKKEKKPNENLVPDQSEEEQKG